jgi:hypothetical protein
MKIGICYLTRRVKELPTRWQFPLDHVQINHTSGFKINLFIQKTWGKHIEFD